MECTHDRIKSVNCRIYCDICGVELPLEWLTEKHPSTDEQPANGQEKPKKTTRKRKV